MRGERIAGSLDRPARRRLARGGAAAIQSIGVPAASVLVSLVAVRAAGPQVWGAFVGAMVLVGLTAQVADLGSRDALVRAFSRDPGGATVAWRRAAASRAPLLLLGPIVFLVAGADPAAVLLMSAWLAGSFVVRLHEGVVAYRRAFPLALGVEVAALAVTVALVVLAGSSLTITLLLAVFALAAWLRALALAWRLGVARPGPGWEPSVGELRRSWPFFALTFSGAVQGRIDLYVAAVLLPDAQLGTYQVLTSFVLLVQGLAGALAGPIVPALYRLDRAGVLRAARRLGAVGLLVGTAGAAAGWLLLTGGYHLEVSPATMAGAWVAMLPAFGYLPLVHLAFREADERVVIMVTLAGIAVTGAGAAVAIPAFGLAGAIWAAALGQVAILGLHVARTTLSRDRGAAAPDLLDGRPEAGMAG